MDAVTGAICRKADTMIKKIRPFTDWHTYSGEDGRSSTEYIIDYYCPTCHRRIYGGYMSSDACDQCGTFYDWGSHAPKIQVIRKIAWDE